jgi:hypothetical protein
MYEINTGRLEPAVFDRLYEGYLLNSKYGETNVPDSEKRSVLEYILKHCTDECAYVWYNNFVLRKSVKCISNESGLAAHEINAEKSRFSRMMNNSITIEALRFGTEAAKRKEQQTRAIVGDTSLALNIANGNVDIKSVEKDVKIPFARVFVNDTKIPRHVVYCLSNMGISTLQELIDSNIQCIEECYDISESIAQSIETLRNRCIRS